MKLDVGKAIKRRRSSVRNDLAGRTYGRLSVVKHIGRDKNYNQLYSCKCLCGKEVVVMYGHLISGHTGSCGCLQRERTGEAHTTHGLSRDDTGRRSVLYHVWQAMKERCLNENSKAFNDYGGREITVCAQWKAYPEFYQWAMANGYKKGLTIDRINNNAGYSPDNCQWITRHKQARNKRNTVFISHNGETLSVSEWAERTGIKGSLLCQQIRRGWSASRVIETAISKGIEI